MQLVSLLRVVILTLRVSDSAMFMQREGLHQQTETARNDLFAISIGLQAYPTITRRFIVLVPPAMTDDKMLLRTVWAMAKPDAIPILYLGLAGRSAPEEDETRMCLATLASLTRDDQVDAQTYIAREANWLNAVRRLWRPGDVVICQAEQMTMQHLFGWQPLWKRLEQCLGVPVYIVAGAASSRQLLRREEAARSARLRKLLSSFLASMFIVAGSFYVQLRIDWAYAGVLRTALWCISGVVEAGLLGIWNIWSA